MKKYMIGLGIASFLVATIGGIMSSNFGGFLLGILSGLISSGLFFGIAFVLDEQESISANLNYLKNIMNSDSKTGRINVVCKKCEREYSPDYSSCPYCGNRP